MLHGYWSVRTRCLARFDHAWCEAAGSVPRKGRKRSRKGRSARRLISVGYDTPRPSRPVLTRPSSPRHRKSSADHIQYWRPLPSATNPSLLLELGYYTDKTRRLSQASGSALGFCDDQGRRVASILYESLSLKAHMASVSDVGRIALLFFRRPDVNPFPSPVSRLPSPAILFSRPPSIPPRND